MSHDEDYEGTVLPEGETLQEGYTKFTSTYVEPVKVEEKPFIGNRHHRRKMQALIRYFVVCHCWSYILCGVFSWTFWMVVLATSSCKISRCAK